MILADLPDDILIQIAEELDLASLLSFRKTCKSASAITRVRSIWQAFLEDRVIQRELPVYRSSNQQIPELSISELELCVRKSLLLHANWTSSIPRCKFEITVPARPDLERNRIIRVGFLPGHRSRWLITVSSHPQDYMIQCWDTHHPSLNCVAERHYSTIPRILINSDHSHPAIMSVTFLPDERNETILIGLTFHGGMGKFVELKRTQHYPIPLALRGPYLIASDADHIVHLVNINTDQVLARLSLPIPTVPRPDEFKCLSIYLASDYLITFRKSWIILYKLPATYPTDPLLLAPCSEQKWQYSVDSIVLTPAKPTRTLPHLIPTPTLNLAIRFDSWFPWPVNVIHYHALPAPENDTLLPPRPISSTESPLRLFSPSDMVLGRYGTLLWTDSQIDAGGDESDHGQRIASRIVSLGDVEDEERRPSLLAVREDRDSWSTLALDEEGGRVVAGQTDGTFTLFDYSV